ncbi:GPI mannosyltransferase 2 [Aspergillus japonicus CBS 114.51]|uniref:GPI mannosyltransferase 2 n=1 Tax=Aspergillus japonicus CBS 114.51 TaxID=1448312 RepID=A0A8T8WZH3_ASPJA|nr:GPI mannosyltransferase 2 [Aspergillus japonicus CBS 114.51]RAH80719.1 GPI mannosyltransferase 2 [Aspergillus japonicus CBS 114.51]
MALMLRVDASRPYRSLLAVFTLWKSLLLLLAAFTPGPGYDTSTTLIQWNSPTKAPLPAMLEIISTKLTRWDAIYYTHAANRGYIFEQEWAFGYGYNRLIHALANGCRKLGILDYAFNESLVGISISHAAHGLSVIVLYHLVCTLFPGAPGRKVALLAACLHVVSPAGAFLSAPCAESAHALLSFCGSLLFVRSFASSSSSSSPSSSSFQDTQLVLAGVLYGLATTFRSNGLLNGIPLFEEAVRQLVFLFWQGFSPARLRRLLAVGTAGLCTGLGFVLPQYIAYREFCTSPKEPRVWCRRTLPSIYSYVQDHYWDNGFLRYWTVSNIPLFGLAAPMLAILLASGWQALSGELRSSLELPCAKVEKLRDSPPQARVTDRLLRSLAVPQVVIAVLTFFNHHVQIITRMASGYPVWYVWVAYLLLQRGLSGKVLGGWIRRGRGGLVVNYMVVYALVQGVLYAAFLPPA